MRVRSARLLIMVAVAGVAGAFWLFYPSHQQKLGIDLVGYTNHFRGMGREAIVAVTNRSDATLIITFLPERKNPEWPMPNRMALRRDVILSANTATNYEVRLQPNDGVWRVRVLSRNPTITKWQGIRLRWLAQLKARKWDRFAAFVEPNLAEMALTPEIKL